jgi:hypothetical protein
MSRGGSTLAGVTDDVFLFVYHGDTHDMYPEWGAAKVLLLFASSILAWRGNNDKGER